MAAAPLCTSHHAWLAAYYCALQTSGALKTLKPSAAAEALARAVEADYPHKAQEIREWNTATCNAMLGVLDDIAAKGTVERDTRLWDATRGARRLSCVAVQLPQGIDLRLVDAGNPERTSLLSDRTLIHREAESWRAELADDGWRIDEA